MDACVQVYKFVTMMIMTFTVMTYQSYFVKTPPLPYISD